MPLQIAANCSIMVLRTLPLSFDLAIEIGRFRKLMSEYSAECKRHEILESSTNIYMSMKKPQINL
jgi:hypothetical protein